LGSYSRVARQKVKSKSELELEVLGKDYGGKFGRLWGTLGPRKSIESAAWRAVER